MQCCNAKLLVLFSVQYIILFFNLGLQRRIRHESPFALYVNCRNHRLALCLVHLIKKYPVLQEIDSLLISLWKLFEFSPQKMAVFKNIDPVCVWKRATDIPSCCYNKMAVSSPCMFKICIKVTLSLSGYF